MNNSVRKPLILLIIISGVGLFLPLVKMSDVIESASISFFDGKDGKIILGVLVITLILQFFKNKKINKIISLILIIIAGGIFFYDTSKISDIKKMISALAGSSVIRYGIGYYMSFVGIVLSFILCIINLVSNNDSSSYYEIDYSNITNMNNQPTNNIYNTPTQINNNQSTSNQPVNNQLNTSSPQNNSSNNMAPTLTLSDLIKKNSNQNNQNNQQ